MSVKYLIIGGGVTAAQAAVGIRELDANGSILIAAGEDRLPYDRPPLSKGMLLGRMDPEDAESKDPSFYVDNSVEVRKGYFATSVDRANHRVTFADGSQVEYEKLLLATGSSPRSAGVPGEDLDGVTYFRTVEDSLWLRNAVTSRKRVVMMGAGYVGMEVGDRLMELGAQVTIIHPGDYPWSKFASAVTGGHLRRYMESRGATVLLNDEVIGIEGTGFVTGVRTRSAKLIPCDVVVVGVGVSLNLDLARQAELEIDEKHGVVVQESLRTSDPSVWAAGDIAAFPDVTSDRRWHAEHQLNAKWQGKTAGRNMAGANETYDKVPYFFSDLVDTHMILRGDPYGGKSSRVFGDATKGEFVELYERSDRSLAMGIAFSRDESALDPISDRLEELIRSRANVPNLDPSDIGLASA